MRWKIIHDATKIRNNAADEIYTNSTSYCNQTGRQITLIFDIRITDKKIVISFLWGI